MKKRFLALATIFTFSTGGFATNIFAAEHNIQQGETLSEISTNNRWLRLFKDRVLQKQYPIAVGRMLHDTPIGEFIIINKAPNPGGPFGTMWMSLSKEHYGIHGTNDPSSIGKSVSRGCIRMHNHDVEELASIIPIGTRVVIHQ